MAIEDTGKQDWVKIETDMLEDTRYMEFSDERSYRGGDYKRPGYNPNHNSTRIEKIRIDVDRVRLRSY